jgi:hypothetical protein
MDSGPLDISAVHIAAILTARLDKANRVIGFAPLKIQMAVFSR